MRRFFDGVLGIVEWADLVSDERFRAWTARCCAHGPRTRTWRRVMDPMSRRGRIRAQP